MTKSPNSSLKGPDGFEQYYSAVFGKRWKTLKLALLQNVDHIAWPAPQYWDFHHPPPDQYLMRATWHKTEAMRAYFMDYASAFAPLSLGVSPGENVWDMCAAPGGKSLVLAHALQGTGKLLLTDRSGARVKRLRKVIQEFLSEKEQHIVEARIADSKTLALKHRDVFDKILLDAPCSSERHLLQDSRELLKWSYSRTKKMALEQGTLLCSALIALRPGGRMVYSTCALSPLENDQRIDWFIEKRKGKVRVIREKQPFGEETEYGHIFLPDQDGFGPLYLAILEKISS